MSKLLLVQSLIALVVAQTDFTWGFNQAGASLTECGTVQFGIYEGNGSTGNPRGLTPPFYAFTYPVDTANDDDHDNLSPSIQSLGNGRTADYQVRFPAGTPVVIGVVDAFSLFGGWSNPLTVAEGSNDDCLDGIAEPPLRLTLNTTQVSTCGVVGIQASGGTAPYTFTVFPINGVTETFNVTSGGDQNFLSWVNTFGPSNQVSIGVRDATGRWAPTAGPVQLVGEAQSCSFASTTSNGPPPSPSQGTSSSSPPAETGNNDNSGGGSSSNAGAIAGGVVGGLVALALLLFALWFLRRRKRRQPVVKDKRYSYHNVMQVGRSSPQLTGVIPADAAVTPFSLSSTGASQGHSAPGSQLSSSQQGDRPEMSMTSQPQPAVLGGFRVANPSELEETLVAPSAPFGRRGSGDVLGSAESKAAEGSRLSLDSQGQPRVVQAQDAGPLPAEETEEIPPAYTGIRR